MPMMRQKTTSATMPLEFQQITLKDQERYLTFLARCPQITSDYSFANIFGWAVEYGLEWCFEENLVWLRQRRPEPLLWAPVGDWEGVDWTAFRPWLYNAAFHRVPEKLTEIWHEAFGERMIRTEAPGQWDYIYSVPELIELKGNRFHKKKNLLRQFQRNYRAVYHALDMDCVERVLEMQSNWCTWKECADSHALEAENTAIERVLQEWDSIPGLMGGALEVEGEIVAYTVAEALTADTVVIHFEKGNTGVKGVYQAINNLFLADAASGFKYVNREQDLDDEGLRKAKLSYNPICFLKKYGIRFVGAEQSV
ncbi:DUF2156 domain-containing protein [Desulfonatronum thiodismutans]|uniref:DUF2156 domain-containing protein n=1 Tax=Desulfonatronum thiodismutans TaxID=159290 RepID=UPI002DF73228